MNYILKKILNTCFRMKKSANRKNLISMYSQKQTLVILNSTGAQHDCSILYKFRGSGCATPKGSKSFAILKLKNGLKLIINILRMLKLTKPMYTL